MEPAHAQTLLSRAFVSLLVYEIDDENLFVGRIDVIEMTLQGVGLSSVTEFGKQKSQLSERGF